MRPPLLLLVFITSGCTCWYTGDRPDVPVGNPDAPTVYALAVIPPDVYVTPGAQFVLYVRMYDHLGGVLPAHARLNWTAGSGLKERGHDADSVKIEVLPTATPLTTSVTANIDQQTASATVRVLVLNVQGAPDSVLGDNTVWSPPDVAVVLDTLATPPVHDSIIAYLKTGLVGNLHGGPGEVVRFSTTELFRLQPETWHSGSDVVNFASPATTVQVANRLRQAPFRIWIASTDPRADSFALVDAGYAAKVFIRQRTGIRLQPTISFSTGAGSFVHELGPPPIYQCLGLSTKLRDLGIPVIAPTFSKDSLNVVYVDDLVDPPIGDQVPLPAGLNGYSCPADLTIGSVIFVSMRSRGPGTLTHEFGHGAGLVEPEWGHTNYQSGFSYTNMMWRYEWDATTAPRSIFSVGQAFRVNADDHSWMRWQTGQSRDCDSLRVGRNCPLLEADVVTLP